MKRLALVAALLAAIGGGVAAFVLTSSDGEAPAFTEADAEATVRRALERCDHQLRDARVVDCVAAGDGFACRAGGRLVAAFDAPDPEQPEFSVVC